MLNSKQHKRSKALVFLSTVIISVVGIGTAIASKTAPQNQPDMITEAQSVKQGTHGAVCKESTKQTLCFSSALEFHKQITSEQYDEISGYQSKLRDDLYNMMIMDSLKDKFISIDEYIELRNTYFDFDKYKEKVEYEAKLKEIKKELMELS